jgi:hypothetical protein
MPKILLFFILLFVTQIFSSWKILETGLELDSFHSPSYHDSIPATITVLRINPAFFSFRLLCSSAPDQGSSLSAKQWCKKEHLVAAINASMYQADYKTSVSLMKTSLHTNNSYLSKDKTILAFNPKDSSVPNIMIIDRQCDDFATLKQMYFTFVQNIRMISCTRKNVWSQGEQWSIAALGTDTDGKTLFIFSSAPHSVHEFNAILMKLPVNIDRAMYLEGGHIAQMAISTGKFEKEYIGEYTGTGNSPLEAPEIPNVIGIVRKEK